MIDRVEVIGNIASGKTTLVRLMEGEFNVLLENFKENPFWEAFYEAPEKFSFETELTFTLQHYHQIKSSCSLQDRLTISDFSLWLDAAYAEVTLSRKFLDNYYLTHELLLEEVGLPRAVIYLQCGLAELDARIKARDRKPERGITLEYLANIDKKIFMQLAKLESDGVQIVTIDSEDKDFAHNGKHIEEIFRTLKVLR